MQNLYFTFSPIHGCYLFFFFLISTFANMFGLCHDNVNKKFQNKDLRRLLQIVTNFCSCMYLHVIAFDKAEKISKYIIKSSLFFTDERLLILSHCFLS